LVRVEERNILLGRNGKGKTVYLAETVLDKRTDFVSGGLLSTH